MIHFDNVTRENIKKTPQTCCNDWYKILIIGGSGFWKSKCITSSNKLLYTNEIYLYGKGQYQAKYQLLINKQ